MPLKKKVVESPIYKFIPDMTRQKLSEGRSRGLGFAFCKPEGESLIGVQPVSPCKDYLNDVVYSEATGKGCIAYGLNYKKKKIFEEGKGFIVMEVCPNWDGSKHALYDKEVEALKDNYKAIESFLNFFEEKIGIKKSVITELDENQYLLQMPLFWTKYTYLISLYTLLIRIAQDYKEGDPQEFLNNYKGADSYLFLSVEEKFQKILKGVVPEQVWSDYSGGYDVHSAGILQFNF